MLLDTLSANILGNKLEGKKEIMNDNRDIKTGQCF